MTIPDSQFPLPPFTILIESVIEHEKICKYNRIAFAGYLETLVSYPDRTIVSNGLNQLRISSSSWDLANDLLNSSTFRTKGYKLFIPTSLVSRQALAHYVDLDLSPQSISTKLQPVALEKIISIRRRTMNPEEISGFVEFVFSGVTIPDSIFIFRAIFKLTLCVPPPKRCHKCQRYRHIKEQCRATHFTCEFCGDPHE